MGVFRCKANILSTILPMTLHLKPLGMATMPRTITPPGLVMGSISRTPETGFGQQYTLLSDRTLSNVSSAIGSASAEPTTTCAVGSRGKAAAQV
jgi:hypothetical protein